MTEESFEVQKSVLISVEVLSLGKKIWIIRFTFHFMANKLICKANRNVDDLEMHFRQCYRNNG